MYIHSLALVIGPTFCPPPPPIAPLPWGDFLKIESFHPWVQRKAPMEEKSL